MVLDGKSTVPADYDIGNFTETLLEPSACHNVLGLIPITTYIPKFS